LSRRQRPATAGKNARVAEAVAAGNAKRVLADSMVTFSQAARVLGIHRRSLQRKLAKDAVVENQ
jgi:ActR/RegA family two-component response regulator